MCGALAWVKDHSKVSLVDLTSFGRAVSGVADELGCSWHRINSTIMAWRRALLKADTNRVGVTEAVGLDEILHDGNVPKTNGH